ncbi:MULTISPECIES: lysophospholipid acyltransferase family protein [Kitasatospora]|uniref:Putative 1-acylglycerol-3-phosphate O-acyltransferase n=1 Tax=Kitasatospora setae (strain ATCC 33774 / DSM 43861 / JCM 3304 / KCC A-0304 / NBRC 14216 / KM-6054) TaxID=452652 RepID=E4N380_KITSK|nr:MULTISPECIES: lysophospholipid acyltransferase family protein [Kitasatospora]BAJ32614.1 putative 1-acylglycerol-3-phosphate O-acyltransferase [Kitasatospora setae KM-6054]
MSAWLPTAPCTPGDCVTVAGPRAGLPRRVLRLAACLAVLAAGLLAVPLVRALAWLPTERLVRCWARLLLAALGVRARALAVPGPARGRGRDWGRGWKWTRGRDRAAGGSLVVANHVSWLDILLVASVRPGRMLAKTEVGRWPVLGPLTSWGGTILLDRDRLRALPGTVDEIAAALRAGGRVVVFPEGSTWCGHGGGRFRPALFEAAVRADAPVQPLVLRYRTPDGRPSTAPAFVGEDGLLASMWRVVSVRALTAEVEFLPQLPPALFPSRRHLAAAAQRVVDRRRHPDGTSGTRACPGCTHPVEGPVRVPGEDRAPATTALRVPHRSGTATPAPSPTPPAVPVRAGR